MLNKVRQKIFTKTIDQELVEDFKKNDKFMLNLMLMHWVLVSTFSGFFYGTYILGIIGGGMLFAITYISYKLYSGTRLFQVIVGIALMTFTIISIQQNLGRIEMHFHVFIALSFLTVYKDFWALTIASIYTIIYHLLFTYLQLHAISILDMNIMIFNYGCGYDIALLHAFYVIFEFIVLYLIIKKSRNNFIKIYKYEAELQRLLKSYDNNVIFSQTDLYGNITNASNAFCEISGYSKEELIGHPHNMVRHPDMPSSAFKEIWLKLKAGKQTDAEVLNKTKDGGFYWVKSHYEPDYDSLGNKIGYSSTRYDITANKEVELLHEEIEETQKEVIFTMGSIGEFRSKETGNHVKRVAEYSKILALHYGLDNKTSEMLKQSSPMHDIGKIAIPDAILNKPGRFDEAERAIMDTHAQLGYDMLKISSRPLLKMAAIVAYEHHEKWDGTGYPNKTSGEDIHIYGRITALADVFDALGSDRVYKKAWSDEKIFNFFKAEKGKHFDPKLIDIFFDNLDEFLRIRDSHKDEYV